MTLTVCIIENDKGNVDMTISRERNNYPLDYDLNHEVKVQPMHINNLPKDYIGSMLQKYYELVEEGKQ